MQANRIRVSGDPKRAIDAELLLQAILVIAEQLGDAEVIDRCDAADSGEQRESA